MPHLKETKYRLHFKKCAILIDIVFTVHRDFRQLYILSANFLSLSNICIYKTVIHDQINLIFDGYSHPFMLCLTHLFLFLLKPDM